MNKKLIKQVAKVIGKNLAKHELSIAYASDCTNNHAACLYDAFSWVETPQGGDFWEDVYHGKWPYNYKRGI